MLSRRRWSLLFACLLTFFLSVHPWVGRASDSLEGLLQQSQQRYEAGHLDEAKGLLLQIQQTAQAEGNQLVLAIALSNLALVESAQGDGGAANQAIASSLQTLKTAKAPNKTAVLAQVLNVQGRLQLAQGDAQNALQTWQQTATLYRQAGNPNGEIQSQLRQVQALRAMGLHSRAYQTILLPLKEQLQKQPDSATKVWGLRSLGEEMSIVGSLTAAETVLQDSLKAAERLDVPQEKAATQLSLANLLSAKIRDKLSASQLKRREREQLKRDITAAIALYQSVTTTPSPNQLRAQLNLLSLLVDTSQTTDAQRLVTALQPTILNLPSDRPSIEARLNFTNSLLHLQKAAEASSAGETVVGETAISVLNTAVAQATALNDSRLLANALGNLARVQEQKQQWQAAQTATERAILLAKAINAPDQLYRWSAQLGRLQEKQGNRQGAIDSYSQAVNILRTLRSDLLGLNAEHLLVDSETLEPVHRQLVSLLLPRDGSQPTEATLQRTREVIESLQLEEINNYLRAACLQSQVEIDQVPVPNKTAVIYPIILPDRVAIIVSVTGQEAASLIKQQAKDPTKSSSKKQTILYTQPIPQVQIEATIKTLQDGLRNRISLEYKHPSEQLYGWLIQPLDAELQSQKVETLVFVLDGAFRNVPMAALSDGQKFLVEKYSIATTPGLKLTSPQPLQTQKLSSVAFGLTEPRTIELSNGGSQTFSELPFVKSELEDLQAEIPSQVELDKQFTSKQFQETLQKSQAPIVHLATHGQFSSDRDQTFLLTSDGVIDIDELAASLGAGDTRTTPIELLVLSACETAIGDDRAPLGLAGIALKSGARSTIASLWKVNDTATSLLMQRFYKELATRQVTKAEALQKAQEAILEDPQFRRHPYFWAPFILVGNWL
ncbi:MAG: CHAT domain-containing protein [Scytolyngbya sp. HA4215-MV1]|jgi:CHAT domain-containing protein|nr:CHAT domain-containing protein [Scytolyngbya sp. HA4215-MV1]